MVRAFGAGVVAVLLAVAPAHADVRFLGSNPIGPLVVVRGGVPQTPGARACRSWAPVGSRWRELDTFGRIAGDVTVHNEEGGEWYGDFTLSLGSDGVWHEVAPGIFGSTS